MCERNAYDVKPLENFECDAINIEDFFYETFYVPQSMESLPRDIVRLPYYQKYIHNLGNRKGDCCYIAYHSHTGKLVGMVWTRIIDEAVLPMNNMPYLLISVSAEHRGKGVGSLLLQHILTELKYRGYTKVGLTVNKQNAAINLYIRYGFVIFDDDDENYIMVCELKDFREELTGEFGNKHQSQASILPLTGKMVKPDLEMSSTLMPSER